MSIDPLAGCRILVIEDEMMVLMLMEDMLTELGCVVVAASSVHDALQILSNEEFDGATLDINLQGRTSYPVADALAAKSIPFVFASGYGNHLNEGYQHLPHLKKPFRFDDLADAMRRLVGNRAPTGGFSTT